MRCLSLLGLITDKKIALLLTFVLFSIILALILILAEIRIKKKRKKNENKENYYLSNIRSIKESKDKPRKKLDKLDKLIKKFLKEKHKQIGIKVEDYAELKQEFDKIRQKQKSSDRNEVENLEEINKLEEIADLMMQEYYEPGKNPEKTFKTITNLFIDIARSSDRREVTEKPEKGSNRLRKVLDKLKIKKK